MAHVFRIAGLVIVLGVAIVGPSANAAPAACIPASQCCRVCDKGAACGNSCISRAKTCHKGRGCACDLSEICPDP